MKARRAQRSRTVSVPSPVGGWNARDPLADMKPNEAVILDNFFCTPYDVRLRPGYTSQATGISGTVNSLMAYNPPSGNGSLFAVAGANVYDVTTPGAVGAAVLSHLTNDGLRKINFGTGGGNFMIAVNGADLPLVYSSGTWGNIFGAAFNTSVTSITNSGTLYTVTMAAAHNLQTGMTVTIAGATSTAPTNYNGTFVITRTGANTFTYTATASGSSPAGGTITATPAQNFAITGVTPSLLTHVNVFKNRIFFVESGSMRAWYMPTQSIGGAASQLDFSTLFTRGGYLVAMGTWTVDGGYGLDDYAVWITSEGQVAIYRGTDPASANTWSLVGVYMIAPPLGRNCFQKYGGDLVILSKEGLAPLTQSLISSAVTDRMMLTDRIQSTISDYTTAYGALSGWSTTVFPEENALIVNVPISTTQAYQTVMNTISGAWSRYIGWNALSWERFGASIYFGTVGGVNKAWTGLTDGGSAIQFEALQSFNYMGSASQLKQVKMVRPTVTWNNSGAIKMGVNADFDTSKPASVLTLNNPNVGLWDTATWDGAQWSDVNVYRDWQSAFALGYALGAHLVGVSNNSTVAWAATDYLIEDGGVL